MLKMGLRMAKRGFFNTERVKRAVGAAERRVLSRYGAYVRSDARKSLRRRKSSSDPGQPPRVHTKPGLRFILFAYDFRKGSVVIGPVRLHGGTTYGQTTVPELMEFGGTVKSWRDDEIVHYEARPFMGPAHEKNLPELPAMWRDSIR